MRENGVSTSPFLPRKEEAAGEHPRPSRALTGLASPGRIGLRARNDDRTILSQTALAWEISP